jgi:superfamily II DNA or RNA helicase
MARQRGPEEADLPDVGELQAEIGRLRDEIARLRSLLGLDDRVGREKRSAWEPTLFPATHDASQPIVASVDQGSPAIEKVALFRSLFSGRSDIHARRWENERSGKSGWSPAVEGGWGATRGSSRRYLPLDDVVIDEHLSGRIHAGLYPLLPDDTCNLLACDFDGPGWALDALAYIDAADATGVPTALEQSRSGNGAHVWVFFEAAVPASVARRIGVQLLRRAMSTRSELDLDSYDRLFPTQDTMPKGQFGNLIALPLQGGCRQRGTTVFLDPATMEPYQDQWAFLFSVERLPAQSARSLAEILGEVGAGPDSLAYRQHLDLGATPLPETIRAVAGAVLAIDRIGTPPALLAALKHLASVHNPEFYEKERMRFSTWNTPRFVRTYRETIDQLLIPRGLHDKAAEIVSAAGSTLTVTASFADLPALEVELVAELTSEQRAATDALVAHDLGVLVAPPGSGKTVVGCAVIAERREPTLVLVDRQPLVDQWRERLTTHLEIGTRQIGQFGAGRRKLTGIIDVAMVQSLARLDEIGVIATGYGLVIVDECHHVPAVTFERVVRQISSRHWVGLTATPYRRDGLQAIIGMHVGPKRHTMGAPSATALRALDLVVHETDHLADDPGGQIQGIFRGIVDDDARTTAICRDIAVVSAAGRNSLVLTRWREHLDKIAAQLGGLGVEPLILHGQMGKKARNAVMDQLADPANLRGMVLVATASLLGEGFDCPPLDTLFMAFPIKFKGSVVQYVGRVLRPTATKTRVQVHDYVDGGVPVLARMHDERRAAYISLGFDIPRRRPR